jgi:RNA recognition motif-containing protein
MSLPPHLLNMKVNNLNPQQPPVNPNTINSNIYRTPGSVDSNSILTKIKARNRIKKMSEKKKEMLKNPNTPNAKKLLKLKKSKDLKKKWKILRNVGGEVWEDQTLADWPEDDYRIFVGDLGNEVSDEVLANAFRKYPSFNKARVIRDKRTGKTKGFGFVSIKEPEDYIKAMREMNGKYIGNRPVKLRKSNWKDRSLRFSKSKVENVKYKKNRVRINKKLLLQQQNELANMQIPMQMGQMPFNMPFMVPNSLTIPPHLQNPNLNYHNNK